MRVQALEETGLLSNGRPRLPLLSKTVVEEAVTRGEGVPNLPGVRLRGPACALTARRGGCTHRQAVDGRVLATVGEEARVDEVPAVEVGQARHIASLETPEPGVVVAVARGATVRVAVAVGPQRRP